MIRSNPREVPPEIQTMGGPGISVLFSMSGCGRGRNTGMVLSH
jgi:hypothetical protein